jgi:hypothetical protein
LSRELARIFASDKGLFKHCAWAALNLSEMTALTPKIWFKLVEAQMGASLASGI